MAEDTLWIVTETEEIEAVQEASGAEGRRSSQDVGGGFGPPRQVFEAAKVTVKRKRVPLDAKALKAQMQGMISTVNELFDQATSQTGLQLNEVELSVEINAEGQVSLIGTGGKVSNKGGITLKFTRLS